MYKSLSALSVQRSSGEPYGHSPGYFEVATTILGLEYARFEVLVFSGCNVLKSFPHHVFSFCFCKDWFALSEPSLDDKMIMCHDQWCSYTGSSDYSGVGYPLPEAPWRLRFLR